MNLRLHAVAVRAAVICAFLFVLPGYAAEVRGLENRARIFTPEPEAIDADSASSLTVVFAPEISGCVPQHMQIVSIESICSANAWCSRGDSDIRAGAPHGTSGRLVWGVCLLETWFRSHGRSGTWKAACLHAPYRGLEREGGIAAPPQRADCSFGG